MSKSAIFVLGMHRSGTSALAGALAACDIWFGDDLLEPAAGINDKGFWEHRELVRINEQLLETAGLRWYSPLAVRRFSEALKASPELFSQLIRDAVAFVANLQSSAPQNDCSLFAIKDPRLCITADFWKPVFEQEGLRVAAIELVRHPAQVSQSLAKRDGIVPSHSNVLWLDHVMGHRSFCERLESTYTASYDALMESPAALLSSAMKALDVVSNLDASSLDGWIQPSLHHHKSVHDASGLLADEAVRLYEDTLHGPLAERQWNQAELDYFASVTGDIESQFIRYNETVIQLQDVSARLDELGAKHTEALKVIGQRDEQIQRLTAEHEGLGEEHTKALKVIGQRDEQLQRLTAEHEELRVTHGQALDASRLKDDTISEQHARFSELEAQLHTLGDHHSHAQNVVVERDRQLAELNQYVNAFRGSLLGRMFRIWSGGKRLLSRSPADTKQPADTSQASAGKTQYPVKNQRPPVDVIIPVYGGFKETCAAVESAASSLDRSWARLVVINDCSPEPEITQWLRDQSKPLEFELLENDKNLGFVGTVNRGMALSPESDVLLLNSDVEVANDWLERLQDCAYSRQKVASVTATANNATICSFPVFCEDNELPRGFDVESLDQVFKQAVPANMAVEIPTGVGCCMYMRRDSMDDIGLFDEETFGRGYGEENDWCQRAIKHDWQNLHALNVFVYHKGAVSFAEESNPRKEENLRVLSKRYPNYLQDVHAFIARDQGGRWRTMAYSYALAVSGKPIVLAIGHGMGGGVKTNIREIQSRVDSIHQLLLEPVSGSLVNVYLSSEEERGPMLSFDVELEYSTLLAFLKVIGVGHLHFHHTMGVPTRLWGLAKELGVQYDYTLHDYWVVNGNPTLTGGNGVFAGNGTDRDLKCGEHYLLPEGVSASDWRVRQLPLMEAARYLITPSYDTAIRVRSEEEFCDLDSWIVAPHLDHGDISQEVDFLDPGVEKLRVVVLGALGKEKGADFLEKVATRLAKSNIEFHLMGYAYRPLSDTIITHGPYPEEDGLQRLLSLDPDIVWFPAQWPETYSYTLSIALQARCPVVAPAMGAFPERLANRERSILLDKWFDVAFVEKFWREVSTSPEMVNRSVAPSYKAPDFISYSESFYFSEYLNDLESGSAAKELINEPLRSDLLNNQTEAFHGIPSKKELVLRYLAIARASQIGRVVSKLVPFPVQRAVKRYLTKKPLHEIIQ